MELNAVDGEVGRALRAYRSDVGMSQDELAQGMLELGFSVTQATVGKIERGERKVTFGEAMAFARVLAIDPIALTREPSMVRQDVLLRQLATERAVLEEAFRRFERAQAEVASETMLNGIATPELRKAYEEGVDEIASRHAAAMAKRVNGFSGLTRTGRTPQDQTEGQSG